MNGISIQNRNVHVGTLLYCHLEFEQRPELVDKFNYCSMCEWSDIGIEIEMLIVVKEF